ncbi:hypothetical protein R1flu_006504 [Riccia fluitans]|uniref:Uncharacterized protein n=1 Tax=Riccia fluitans TaxID=41844 RepID=A0ABD1YWJ6_9MARC
MPHASTWLGYSWSLADLVVHGLDEIGEGGCKFEAARASRREKFRSNAGASREELLWLEILGILRKVRPTHSGPPQEVVTTKNQGGSSCKFSAVSSEGTQYSDTPHNGGSTFGTRLEYLLEEVMWPCDKVGDIAEMRPVEIAWEDIPSSADPVAGGGYKTECASETGRMKAMKNRAAYVMSPCCIGKLQIPIEWTLKSTDTGLWFKKISSCNRVQELEAPGLSGIGSSSAILDRNDKTLLETFEAMAKIPVMNNIETVLGKKSRNSSESLFERLQGSVSWSLSYPRSSWLRNCISEKEFQVLARAADWSSYDFESVSSRLHSLCKVVLELDRNEASREVGYWTRLYSLANERAGTVGLSHILIGKP